MEKKEKDKELQKKQGLRLKECRQWRELSQQELAERVGYDAKYISMLETGARSIDWNKAHTFADELSINAAYIMCASDNIRETKALKQSDFATKDSAILQLLVCNGHTIKFIAIPFYPTTRKPEIKERITIDFSLDTLEGFSFDNPVYRYKDGESTKEIVVTDAIIDGVQVPYPYFCLICSQITNYINYTICQIPVFREEQEIFHSAKLAAVTIAHEQVNMMPNGLTPEQIQKHIHKRYDEYLTEQAELENELSRQKEQFMKRHPNMFAPKIEQDKKEQTDNK